MKMKEFGPPEGVRPWRPSPLDPPMEGVDGGVHRAFCMPQVPFVFEFCLNGP